MFVLLGLNLVVFFLSLAIFFSIAPEYKRLYVVGFALSMLILSAVSVIKYGIGNLTLTDAAMILYRGGLMISFAGGALSCFIATKLSKKD